MSASLPPRPRILARASDRATVVEIHDRLYLRLDAEGRWSAFAEGGVLFRRTVDGQVLRPTGRGFEMLTSAQARTVDGWVVRRAGELLEAVKGARTGDLELLGERAPLLERLRRAACGSVPDPAEGRARFERVYPEPVSILPPHRYRDLVVMPATGCPNHACAFCTFYRDRPFRILGADEFRAHLQAVRDLFGAALAERDGVFLGSASALTIPDPVLSDRLRAVARFFGRPRRGIASFHDPDRGGRRTPGGWARLVEEGLVETTVGLETGLAALRREQGKSGDLDRFVSTVAEQKKGGMAVSVTVLVGLGGPARADEHRTATVDVVARMPLEGTDRVYLSPLAGSFPLDRMEEDLAGWRAALAERTAARVGDYRIERFAWFA